MVFASPSRSPDGCIGLLRRASNRRGVQLHVRASAPRSFQTPRCLSSAESQRCVAVRLHFFLGGGEAMRNLFSSRALVATVGAFLVGGAAIAEPAFAQTRSTIDADTTFVVRTTEPIDVKT